MFNHYVINKRKTIISKSCIYKLLYKNKREKFNERIKIFFLKGHCTVSMVITQNYNIVIKYGKPMYL